MPRRPAEIVDRDTEWEALRAAWESPRPELVLALGRRRDSVHHAVAAMQHLAPTAPWQLGNGATPQR